jgi:glyoxylase-like metal-dependent hydrolase (beta-lactamase superfamily II)
MAVQLHAFTCGYLTIPRAFMLEGEEGFIKVPVPSYLVTHPKGRVLFDTGLHAATLEDPVQHIGEMLARYHEFDFHAGEEIGARLSAFGVDPASIDFVINSHLHFDHCGGNAQLPNADILIQRRELEFARGAQNTRGYLLSDWDTGQRVRALDGEHDLFGDGTVVCLPTYGHTPGHQSLRVQTETGGAFVLCGDACYLRDSLEKLRLPGVIADKEAALAVFHRLRDMQARGMTIMYGHDPDFWTGVPQAPVRLG